MSLFISSLNSGSNGNCYYVGNETEAILVDVGISCREVDKRMKRLGLSMQKIKAIFISHEHSDHIRGLCGLIKKYQIPVYITSKTLLHCNFVLDSNLVKNFDAHASIEVGNLLITAFPKLHDASDPYSFVVECDEVKVGVFTDVGAPCKLLIKHFQQCHAAFLESNYDEEMLDMGSYPYHLKRRIRGGNGHLSNNQALDLFIKHRPQFMSHLFLSHLSNNNNCPDIVRELFSKHAAEVKIIIASRFEETSLYHIGKVAHQPKRATRTAVSAPQLAFEFA
ncbi:MAG TPA: MBL fold metallo-hydrolase [Segetibacter sp.]|jgi:phosphoribosyl 1,2-cyclic phosphodiesterase